MHILSFPRTAKQKGFTLIELLMAVGMLSLLMLATTEIFARSFGNYAEIKKIETNISDAQFLMNLLAKELRTSTIVAPAANGSTQSIKFFENSKAECVQYRFNSSTQGIEVARTSAGTSFASCNNTANLSNFTRVGTGDVTGSFWSVASRPITGTSPRVGRVTMTLSVQSGDSTPVVLQTTTSLRDYGYIGL